MRTAASRVFIASLCLMTILAWAEMTGPKTVEVIKPTIPLPLLTVGPIKCDASGNIYERSYEPGAANSVVSRYSRDGKNVTPLAPSPGSMEGFRFSDYVVSPTGQIAVLIGGVKVPEMKIVEIAGSGETLKIIGLQPPHSSDYFRADTLGQFSSGGFLVIGMARYGPDAAPTPFFGVFDASGVFVSDLYELSENGGAKKKFRFRDMTNQDATQAAFSIAQPSGDRLYLLENETQGSQILEINDSGAIFRKISMDSPGYTPNDFFIDGNSGIVDFLVDRNHPTPRYVTIKLNVGQVKHLSGESLDRAGILACFDHGGVATFVHGDSLLRLQLQ